ncbi:MAG: hypothetical protein ABIQ98_03915 [Sphingomicrobium sp.]
MKKMTMIALGAVSMALAVPAAAQDYPLKGGNYWTVGEVTIDDGHFGDYADFLASTARKTNDYAKSKGWIKAYYILSNVNKRANEPDLYLVTITDHLPNVAEDEAREKDMNAFLATTSRAQGVQSGARAKFRHLGGSQLLQELTYKN